MMPADPSESGKIDTSPDQSAQVAASEGETAAAPSVISDRTRLVVGLGASAGGIDAFKMFFSKMPADTGMAFVLVQHLDPNHQSSLVAIVAGYTAMPVHLVEDEMEI